jgi:hypothetical protein
MRFSKICLVGVLLFAACSSPKTDSEQPDVAAATCTEPENPYSEGTGHYAGYEWAEKHDGAACDGNSQSFNEGCAEYLPPRRGISEL